MNCCSWSASVLPLQNWEKERQAWTQSILARRNLPKRSSPSNISVDEPAAKTAVAGRVPFEKYDGTAYDVWRHLAMEWPDRALRSARPAEHWAARWAKEAHAAGRSAGYAGWHDRPARWRGVEGENWPQRRCSRDHAPKSALDATHLSLSLFFVSSRY